MFFIIGLKFNICDLSCWEVWVGSVLYILVWVGVIICCVYVIGVVVVNFVDGFIWKSVVFIVFVFSFSSIVCVVKVLEESGESKICYGCFVIGILVM